MLGLGVLGGARVELRAPRAAAGRVETPTPHGGDRAPRCGAGARAGGPTLAAWAAVVLLGLAAWLPLLALDSSSALAASTTPVPPASNPFTPGIPTPQPAVPTVQSTPTVSTAATSATDSGLSGGGIAAIAVGALVILGGISFYIWYDARRRAPVRARALAGGTGTPGSGKTGSKNRPKPRKLSPAERRRRKRGRAR